MQKLSEKGFQNRKSIRGILIIVSHCTNTHPQKLTRICLADKTHHSIVNHNHILVNSITKTTDFQVHHIFSQQFSKLSL